MSFYDINKFPKKSGLLVFGISMSKVSNSQSAPEVLKQIEYFYKKILYPHVGVQIVYTDTLYLNSQDPAFGLKNKYQTLMLSHKAELEKLIAKKPYLIPTAFAFNSWSQTILQTKSFFYYLGQLKATYKADPDFRRCVEQDILASKKELNSMNIEYILEEITMMYLISKNKVCFQNQYLQNQPEWTLFCYPGEPLKSETYLHNHNLLKLKNPGNCYENSFYDLKDRKLYRYTQNLIYKNDN